MSSRSKIAKVSLLISDADRSCDTEQGRIWRLVCCGEIRVREWMNLISLNTLNTFPSDPHVVFNRRWTHLPCPCTASWGPTDGLTANCVKGEVQRKRHYGVREHKGIVGSNVNSPGFHMTRYVTVTRAAKLDLLRWSELPQLPMVQCRTTENCLRSKLCLLPRTWRSTLQWSYICSALRRWLVLSQMEHLR